MCELLAVLFSRANWQASSFTWDKKEGSILVRKETGGIPTLDNDVKLL
jgi:hypothetical protein